MLPLGFQVGESLPKFTGASSAERDPSFQKDIVSVFLYQFLCYYNEIPEVKWLHKEKKFIGFTVLEVQGQWPTSGDGLLVGRVPRWHKASHEKRQGLHVYVSFLLSAFSYKNTRIQSWDSSLKISSSSSHLPKAPLVNSNWIKFPSS